ncbi:hypothetical protein V8G54_005644, partial [Vigna mungo]
IRAYYCGIELFITNFLHPLLNSMSEDQKKTSSTGHDEMVVSQEQQAKITEVKGLIGQLSDKESVYCSDASISRYLMSRNSNVKKAAQMLKQSLKWRYKAWLTCLLFQKKSREDVAADAESGCISRPNCQEKYGRTVIVSTPRRKRIFLSKRIDGLNGASMELEEKLLNVKKECADLELDFLLLGLFVAGLVLMQVVAQTREDASRFTWSLGVEEVLADDRKRGGHEEFGKALEVGDGGKDECSGALMVATGGFCGGD